MRENLIQTCFQHDNQASRAKAFTTLLRLQYVTVKDSYAKWKFRSIWRHYCALSLSHWSLTHWNRPQYSNQEFTLQCLITKTKIMQRYRFDSAYLKNSFAQTDVKVHTFVGVEQKNGGTALQISLPTEI